MNEPVNIDNLTLTSVPRFIKFVRYLANNDLLGEAEKHLIAQGCKELYVSVEPIRNVQNMLKEKVKSGVSLSEDTKNVIMSGHQNNKC